MRRRIFALVLALALALSLLPMSANAQPADRDELADFLINEYYRAIYRSGRDTLAGYCGLMTSYQLYLRGINSQLLVYDGNGHYDAYCELQVTTGGHSVKTYPDDDYTLEQALNAASNNGTRDVYNLMVCFHQTTTAAGRIYGHVLMIYAIMDGLVYFNESFDTPWASAGHLAVCSIEEFAKYYDPWTWFEGIIVFGRKEYADNCREYPSYMFVQAREETVLYSQPCLPETTSWESEELRAVRPGERLEVTALYENTLGEYFYRVQELGQDGYVPALSVDPIRFNCEDAALTEQVAPQQLQSGQAFEIAGQVSAVYSAVSAVHAQILDAQGQPVAVTGLEKTGGQYDLKKDGLAKDLAFDQLQEGSYTYRLLAQVDSHYLADQQILVDQQQVCLTEQSFVVSQEAAAAPSVPVAAPEEQLADGWHWLENKWYYYENGLPRTGWLTDQGLRYYLQEDGSAITGYVLADGQMRYFTGTGALRTGWLQLQEGKQYLDDQGLPLQGWQKLRHKLYYFGEGDFLAQPGWMDMAHARYYVNPDGSVATGWVLIDGAQYYFDKAGRVLCLAFQIDGRFYISPFNPQGGYFSGKQLLTPSAINQLKSEK